MASLTLKDRSKVLVDDGDLHIVAGHAWHREKRLGHVRRTDRSGGRRRDIYLHVAIMNPPAGLLVDHKDGNVLDNRRSNLRTCTRAQNSMNQTGHRRRSSRFKGVRLVAGMVTSPWEARIKVGGRDRSLGFYRTEEDAGRAYDAAARQTFGEFCRPNFAAGAEMT